MRRRPVEDAAPDDPRVRAAIDQARSFAEGELAAGEAVRRRGGGAGAAARAISVPAARAAAYAAEQAAAVAHMGAHALGAAGYAVKASVLADGGDPDTVIASETRRQAAAAPDPIVNALRSLPMLGTNRSGPLGHGRLSKGHVGQAIRELQAILTDASNDMTGRPA
jgi:hypothetical protein